MLTEIEKLTIGESAKRYIAQSGITQTAFSALVEVDKAYLSNILNGRTEISSGKDRTTPIDDNYYLRIRRFLDGDEFILRSKNYMDVVGLLAFCKEYHKFRIIDGETGAGKSFACGSFRKKNPTETYMVRCADDLGCKELMEELGNAVGVGSEGTRASIRQRIVEKLKREKAPLIIIDEAENLKDGVYGAIKAIADDLKDIAGIVLVGANKKGRSYFDWMRNASNRKTGCFPQIFSRFKSECLVLGAYSQQDVVDTCQYHGITDAKVQKRLTQECHNYRDLCETVKELAFRQQSLARQ